MTDDVKDAAEQEPQGTEQDEQPTTETQADEKPAEDSKPDIDWKAMSRKHEDRSKALATELDDLKKQLETANSAAGRVSELEASVTAAEKRAERAEVAAEVASAKGVKLRYLDGETREELEAAADAWLEDARAAAKVGVVPTQGTGDSAPRTSSYASGAERARAQSNKSK